MEPDASQLICGGCACCGVSSILVLLFGGWTNLGITEAAIQVNWVMNTAVTDPKTAPGMHYIGPWNKYIKYPTTTQQMTFEGSNALMARTSDGLPITLNVFFQYTLAADRLWTLYSEYEYDEGNYEKIIALTARHRLGEIVCNYTAGELFSDKPKISAAMSQFLREYFEETVKIATIEMVSLNEEDLPDVFTNQITEAGNQKQNITTQNNRRQNKEVEFQTALQVAYQQANITVQEAKGSTYSILQNGQAEANIIAKYVDSEITSYKQVQEELDIHGPDLVKYLWYDQVGGGGLVRPGDGMQVFSGVNPASYIDSKQR